MNIAIVAATEMELHSLKHSLSHTNHAIEYYVHGVGILQATFHLQKIASQKPDLIIQCGIAGTYSDILHIGDTVIVQEEILGDTGAEDHESYLDIFDLNLCDKNSFPFTNGSLVNTFANTISSLPIVKGLTVNMSSGDIRTIKRRQEKYNPDIESMEGACLHYVCLQENIPFIQFRGISNRVEPRDKSLWKITDALNNCHQEIIKFIHQHTTDI